MNKNKKESYISFQNVSMHEKKILKVSENQANMAAFSVLQEKEEVLKALLSLVTSLNRG